LVVTGVTALLELDKSIGRNPMDEQADHDPTADPNPSRPVDLDFPTLGRLVEAEARDLYQNAELVNDELKDWTRDQAREPAARTIDSETDIARSPDELIARLNGIGQSAYRLARHMRTLVEFRAIHRAHRADTEAG
jgi:hypothetical protein